MRHPIPRTGVILERKEAPRVISRTAILAESEIPRVIGVAPTTSPLTIQVPPGLWELRGSFRIQSGTLSVKRNLLRQPVKRICKSTRSFHVRFGSDKRPMSWSFPEHTGKLDEEQENKLETTVGSSTPELQALYHASMEGGPSSRAPEPSSRMPSPISMTAQPCATSSAITPLCTCETTGVWRKPSSYCAQHQIDLMWKCTCAMESQVRAKLEECVTLILVSTCGLNPKTEHAMRLDTVEKQLRVLMTSMVGPNRPNCSSGSTATPFMSTPWGALHHGAPQ